ncbi:MAG TPA: hypothetical protein VK815_18775 [Candidatus Acidoferrales bacterium]|jgi:hypothetical protein|nr:hypothetical protein [Candidatus Acidoferrales bacterium]
MIAVKIECDCGQHYAFDVEPVNGRMGTTVACPCCGADGTPAADHVIAQKLGPPPPVEPIIHIPPPKPKPAPETIIPIPPPQPHAAPPTIAPAAPPPPPIAPVGMGLKINKSAEAAPATEPHKIAVSDRELGIVSREQAQAEARAKVSWGDAEDEVIKYLMVQRFTAQEAKDMVGEMFKERLVTVRKTGVRKIITGSGLMCVPVIGYLCFAHIGIIPIKLMGILIMVGLYGAWQVLNGIIALIAPKMESGDVAEQ